MSERKAGELNGGDEEMRFEDEASIAISGTDRHWADDPYWTDALDRYYASCQNGRRSFTIDMVGLERLLINGDGPAYKLMDAMESVHRLEGMDGCRGAPRLVLALLQLLDERSGKR